MNRFLTAKGLLGAALVIAMVLIAIVAPLVIPADYGTRMTMTARLRPPSELHWLGTDQLGRDLFYRVMLGARTSLGIAAAAVLMSLVLGLPIGMAAGFYRGGIDNALMRLVDTLLSFPVLLLALTISAMLGPSIPNAIIAIGVAFTPFLARIVRGEALRVTQMPYVEAARAAGATNLNLILRHVAPNVMPPIIVQATISLAFAVLAEASLSFLGLGTQPPQSSLGANDPGVARLSRCRALDRTCARRRRCDHGARAQHVGRHSPRRFRSPGEVRRNGQMSSTAEPLLASQDDARRPLVSVDDLRVEFKTDGGTIVAVDGVSFSIDAGETVCLVGESGSGKSVTSLSLMRLVEFGGGRISGGKLNFTSRTGDSVDLAEASQDFMRDLRGNQIGMIFQEPMTSLNPVFTIERQLVDGLKAHRGLKGADARARARASPWRAGARAGAPPETISARIVGRHASARCNSHGDGL
jgi:ABC-type dipeptide/oligopeptide/nickel transport system permease subunit/predicted ABC-type transport system involved in lysophospholipase L1 biosynthesis ATPase subunit